MEMEKVDDLDMHRVMLKERLDRLHLVLTEPVSPAALGLLLRNAQMSRPTEKWVMRKFKLKAREAILPKQKRKRKKKTRTHGILPGGKSRTS